MLPELSPFALFARPAIPGPGPGVDVSCTLLLPPTPWQLWLTVRTTQCGRLGEQPDTTAAEVHVQLVGTEAMSACLRSRALELPAKAKYSVAECKAHAKDAAEQVTGVAASPA